jgi:anti-sigma factor ChrR (cupin superfamily)
MEAGRFSLAVFARAGEIPPAATFVPFRAGVHRAVVYEHPSGASMAYLRYEPGAAVPRHRHAGFEHILVLEGEQADDDGTYPAGTLLVHAPGTEHRVWSVAGCLVLAIWAEPVLFLED